MMNFTRLSFILIILVLVIIVLSVLRIAHSKSENTITIDFSDPESIWEVVEGIEDYDCTRSDFFTGREICKSWSHALGGDKDKSGIAGECRLPHGMGIRFLCYGNMQLRIEQARDACNNVLKREFISVDRYIVVCGKPFD